MAAAPEPLPFTAFVVICLTAVTVTVEAAFPTRLSNKRVALAGLPSVKPVPLLSLVLERLTLSNP